EPPRAGDGARGRLDWPGAVAVTAGLMLVVLALAGADEHGWGSAQTLGELAGGLALLALFCLIETRTARPLMPLAILRHRNVALGNGVAAAVGAALFGFYFFITLYLQGVKGLSPLHGGVAMMPAGLATFAVSLIGARVVGRIGIRAQLLLGSALMLGAMT